MAAEQDRCKVCYDPLPPDWFEVCVTCLYKSRLKAANRMSCRPPSYRSPLLALDRKPDGRTDV